MPVNSENRDNVQVAAVQWASVNRSPSLLQTRYAHKSCRELLAGVERL